MIPLLILGLLKQNPGAHGYELLTLMEEQHFKFIVNYTKGSFYYNLQQLEEKKYIKKIEVEKENKVHETHNYVITELGNKEFERLMLKYGSKTEYVNLSFYAAMIFSNEYPKEEMLNLIKIQIKEIKERISLIENALKSDKPISPFFRKMLENSRDHHVVNVKWFEKLLDDI
ncbi:helix-turn-helix transcriptional regulator [Clostridium sp. AL.422]|uniref:PadR family transcriptional regulator n=1 Tax=Clostridium TaxID=1485 RepID=UPI00293DCFA7|nr:MULTISPECIES: helix-turn-helix transcriptional regulator [unclassified Clostridium]MDV4149384.1 helix-turn-helix transcriptional regulator [Clostridium sp. AL.422]